MRCVFLLMLGAACATAAPPAVKMGDRPGWQVGASLLQPDRATGAIAGSIVDAASGAPVFLVTVVASSPALQGTASELTDEAGQFLLSGLPPGTYDLLAIYGNVELRVTGVPVDAGADRWVTARLDVSTSHLVTLGPCGPPAIEPGTAAQKTTVDAEMLKNIPWGR